MKPHQARRGSPPRASPGATPVAVQGALGRIRPATPAIASRTPVCATLATLLCCGALPALAQTDETPEPATLGTVKVVGSHIRRVAYETVQPIVLLERKDLERSGLTSVGEILQQLPQHVSDLNPDVNNGGNGETRVDLRNLGANRTLVLLNGHRYVAALDGAVDVSSIPLPIVDRIELLTDGASAIYGSDAIAGVVNIITRRDYEGLEASASQASSERGDGERRAADVTWGRRGERGSVAFNLSFADQQPIFAGDRAISAVPRFGLPANSVLAGASGHTPNGTFGFGPSGFSRPDGAFGRLTWEPANDSYRPFNPQQDAYNFAPHNYLRTPYERVALFAQGDYTLHPTLSARAALLLHQRRSSQELAPTPIIQSGASGARNNYNIAADNLYNPFGQPVTGFSYRPVVRPRRRQQDVYTHYLSIGLEGLFEIGTRSFVWETYLIDARTRQDQLITGGYDLDRLGVGVGPSFRDADGTPRCGTPAAPLAGCVPVDFLHGQDGFTQTMYDYLAVDAGSRERRRLQALGASASGPVLDLPAGPLNMAAGLEHRRERGSIGLDPLLVDNAFDFGGFAPNTTDGRIRIDEAYVEFAIPLLADRPWAQALDASLAARHSRYSTFGNTTNHKLGLSWRPHADWLLRATWSRGFRAPSTSELFALSGALPTGGPEIALFDPCASNPTGIVAERCRAAGVPVGNFNPVLGPMVLFGSNPQLQPEHARDRSMGVVWSPAAIDGLDLSLGWWRIELSDAIDSIPAIDLGRLCYVQGFSGACDQLTRDPVTGALTRIDARRFNYGAFHVEGYDLGVGYRRSTPWGEIGLRWDTVYLSHYLKELPAGAPLLSTVGNYVNADPGWRVRSLLALDWDRASIGATARLRYYSALDESCFWPRQAGRRDLCDRPDFASPVFGGEPEHVIDARTYTDLQLRWQPRAGTRLTLGVNNAFDRDPPVSFSAFANSYDPSYDVPGRFWYASIRQAF